MSKDLDLKERQLIVEKFEQEGATNNAHSPKSKDFFSKIKKAWQDFK